MPPRISLSGALRHPQTFLKTQISQFSKKAPSQLRDNIPSISNRMSRIGGDPNMGPRDPISDLFDTIKTQPRLRNEPRDREQVKEGLVESNNEEDYLRQSPRRWMKGDVYAPHDLSPAEARKWRRVSGKKRDVVDMLGLRPLDMYRNFTFISEFTTTHGRIKGGALTGLRPVNQRKVAKAIRRAIGLGLHPSVHNHPEILARKMAQQGAQAVPTSPTTSSYVV